jgi:hypothetical protein
MRAPATDTVGALRRVIISNVVCYNADARQGAFISGIPGHEISDLTLSNIRIYFKGGGIAEQAKILVPELEKEYPEPGRFKETPSYGFFIRHVNGLKMKDIEVHYLNADQRPAFTFDSLTGVDLESIRGQHAAGVPLIMLNKVSGFTLRNSKQIADTKLDHIDHKEIE